MRKRLRKRPGLKPAVLACIFLFSTAGCSSVDLGEIDETEKPRDDMPGPGIFADEDGETPLKWTNEKSQAAEETEQANLTTVDEQAEFEQFKKWDVLRSNAAESEEYQEFLQWLKYQEFKATQ